MPNTAYHSESNHPYHNSDHHIRASIARERKLRTLPNAEGSANYAVASYGFDPYVEKQAALNFSTSVNNEVAVNQQDVSINHEPPVVTQSNEVQQPTAAVPEAPVEQTELEQLRDQIKRFYVDGLQS